MLSIISSVSAENRRAAAASSSDDIGYCLVQIVKMLRSKGGAYYSKSGHSKSRTDNSVLIFALYKLGGKWSEDDSRAMRAISTSHITCIWCEVTEGSMLQVCVQVTPSSPIDSSTFEMLRALGEQGENGNTAKKRKPNE